MIPLKHRQGDSLEQLKAMLQRETAGVDLSGIEPLPAPAPAPVPSPDQAYGYDGSQEGERDFTDEGGERGITSSSRGAGVGTGGVSVSVPAEVAKKRSVAVEKRGAKRRGSVRSMFSSTSYKAGSVYDRDYVFDEHDMDLFENKKEQESPQNSKGEGQGQGQEIVTIPCDLTDAGSAVEVMRELKRLGIDDKVAPSLAPFALLCFPLTCSILFNCALPSY